MKAHATAELLSGYLDRELDERRLRLVEGHLEECRECRERLEGLRRVVSRLERLERTAPPPELGHQVERWAGLSSGRGGLTDRIEHRVRSWIVQPTLAPAFAVVLALSAIIYLFSSGVARHRDRPTRIIVQPPAVEQPAIPAPVRELAGRSFVLVGSVWVEEGLQDRTADRRLGPDDPEIESYRSLRELGTARLAAGDEVIEISFAASP